MAVKFGNWQNFLDKTVLDIDQAKLRSLCDFEDEAEIFSSVHKECFLAAPWIKTYFTKCQGWQSNSEKSETTAATLREQGNKHFRNKQYNLALQAYNKCVQHSLPECFGTDDNQRALGLANRSAALYHLEHFEECLADISLALTSGYAESLRYKLYQRRAACHQQLGQTADSDSALKAAESAIKGLTLEDNKKEKLLGDLRKITGNEKVQHSSRKRTAESVVPHHGYGDIITQASVDVQLKYSPDKGRHLVAGGPLSTGSVIIVEKPYAAVLLPSHADSHCHHCFRPTLAVIPCRRCVAVGYCSSKCEKESWTEYHHIECPHADLFQSIGIAHLALRVILKTGLQSLLDFHDSPGPSECIPGLTAAGRYERNYTAVYALMPHIQDIEAGDMVQYALTSVLLLKVLSESSFFVSRDCPDSGSLSPEELYIGGLLLRHVCQLVCNAHAITEVATVTESAPHVDETTQVRVATAIYPTASLMNHACQPNILSSFSGDTLIVRVVEDLSPGDEIYNCYGPHRGRMAYHERQRHLQEQYFFTCRCDACRDQGKAELLHQAYLCVLCGGPVTPVLPPGEGQSAAPWRCTDCGVTTDVRPLQRQQETAQRQFVCGLQALQDGNVADAVRSLESCQGARRTVLYRHHRDIGEVCDVLARCHSIQGDFQKAADYLSPSLEIVEKIYGAESIEVGNELQKYAEILVQSRRLEHALSLARRALAIFTTNYGDTNSCTEEVKQLVQNITAVM